MTARDLERIAATVGREALERLQGSWVAICGVGLLGGQIAQHLALVGVRLILIDPGRIDAENLANQALPAVALKDAKARVRAWQLRLLAPDAIVEVIESPVEALGLGRLAHADLIVSALDGRPSRVRVNEIAFRFGIPWIDAAVDGSGRESLGTVSVFDPRAGTGCYLCAKSDADFAALAREGRTGCASWRAADARLTPPTLAGPAFGGIVSGWAAQRAIDVLLGRGDELAGRQLLIGARPARVREVLLARSERCRDGHARLAPLADCEDETFGALLERARRDLGAEPEELALHGRTLVRGLRCARCGAERDITRCAEAFSDADVRCACGEPAEMTPAALVDRLAAADARALAALRFDEAGLPVGEVVSASAGGRSFHYRTRPAEARP